MKPALHSAVSAILLSFIAFAQAADPPLRLDSRKQLFLDDYLIASMTRVTRAVEPAQKFPGNPVLWPAESWEPPMATLYGSVIREGATFKMWYKSGMGVGYAESDDGIRWNKPRLDLTLINGERSNILFTKKSKTEGPDAIQFKKPVPLQYNCLTPVTSQPSSPYAPPPSEGP